MVVNKAVEMMIVRILVDVNLPICFMLSHHGNAFIMSMTVIIIMTSVSIYLSLTELNASFKSIQVFILWCVQYDEANGFEAQLVSSEPVVWYFDLACLLQRGYSIHHYLLFLIETFQAE